MELYHCTAPNGCAYADAGGSALGCYNCPYYEEVDFDEDSTEVPGV